jgi:hypothetical protein
MMANEQNCDRCGNTRWVCVGCQQQDVNCACPNGPTGTVTPCPDCWDKRFGMDDTYIHPQPGGVLIQSTPHGVYLIREHYVPLRIEQRVIYYNGRMAQHV